jgi:hypothetical protein
MTHKKKPDEVAAMKSLLMESENKDLKRQLAEAKQRTAELAVASELLSGIASAQLHPPKWLSRVHGKSYQAIATALLSDAHFDEVLKPSEIGRVNAYDRNIAQLRLREFFTNAVRLGQEFFTGVRIDGLVLAMLGDICAGNIHEELRETNWTYILDTCLFWADEMAAGIEHLTKFYGKVHCPCVVGNHGRLTTKVRFKGRARDNFDYLIYALLARHFKDSDKVTFQIPEAADAHYNIYTTRYCLSHGDQFRGGTGIAGALSPLLLGDARKRKRDTATNKPYDFLVCGHWHQSIDTCGIIVNNTLKGYDEFAFCNNFPFSEPEQAFWLTDPDKGRTLRAPIHVRTKHEKWDACEDMPDGPLWLKKKP